MKNELGNTMELNSINLLGNSSIGIFGFATKEYAMVPINTDGATEQIIRTTLNVPVIKATVNNSSLNGLFSVGNSNNLVLPHLLSEHEYDQILDQIPDHVEVSVLKSTLTALGNVVLTTDTLALVSPEFSQKEIKVIADLLDVEVISHHVLDTTIVGSMLFTNQNGILAHPLTADSTLDSLEENFKLPVDVVTVNRGTPYPRPGLIGNTHGVLVGSDTTGPELMRIFDVLS